MKEIETEKLFPMKMEAMKTRSLRRIADDSSSTDILNEVCFDCGLLSEASRISIVEIVGNHINYIGTYGDYNQTEGFHPLPSDALFQTALQTGHLQKGVAQNYSPNQNSQDCKLELSEFYVIPLKHQGKVKGVLFLTNFKSGFLAPFIRMRLSRLQNEVEVLFSLVMLEKDNRSQANLLQKNIVKSTIIEVASQVAHDIRSPLAALDMVTNSLKELPEDKRLIIRNSVSRIRDIANDLINRSRNAKQTANEISTVEEKKSTELLQSLIDPLITEKRLQFRSKLDIEIIAQIDSSGYGLFAAIQPTEFKRVLSNLINNSVEAFTQSGVVTITLIPEQKNILVEIKDNGKGIPESVLAKLGARGETHGKEGGSGLGFYHAKKSVEAWGGKLNIASQVGKGTTVTITLPQAKIPHWFVPKLLIYPGHQIVVLDDDSSIHQIWQGRFGSAVSKNITVYLHHFTTEQEIINWCQQPQPDTQTTDIIYLVDYELIDHKKSGLDIIENLGISKKAILVTSRYEEKAIRSRCEQQGIKMIPKGLAGFVPIEVVSETQKSKTVLTNTSYEKCDCVLIDDDALVRMTWGFAAKDKGKILKVFANPKDFLEIAEKIDPKTPLYIDSHLGEDLHGEEIARELFEKYGFSEICLATGYAANEFDLSKMPYLKGVIGKDNPWV